MASLPGSESESRYFGADRSFEKIVITANFWSDGWGTRVFSNNGVYESIDIGAWRRRKRKSLRHYSLGSWKEEGEAVAVNEYDVVSRISNFGLVAMG